jgi:SAM-dependent methyltransferase
MQDAIPVALLELATGYQRSQVLFALVELAVPTLLSGRAMKLDDLASALDLNHRAADMFLSACAALGLLDCSADGFVNSPSTETFLVEGRDTYLGHLVSHYDRVSSVIWTSLASKLRNLQPDITDSDVFVDADQGAESMRAQHNLALLVGQALAARFDFGRHRCLLDLGCGTGAMTLAICEAFPGLRATMMDLPALAALTREYVQAAGLESRIDIVEGNFKEDAIPAGCDCAILANLLSVSSEETNRVLLGRLFDALPAGGAIVISGWILDEGRTSPLIPALFCLEDIIWKAPDVERTVSTYSRWLSDAGFSDFETLKFAPPWSALIGRKR